jgi:hypothetical protein
MYLNSRFKILGELGAIEKNSAILGIFGDLGSQIKNFVQKIKKRVGVRNDIICRTIYQFYKAFYSRFE